MKKKKEGIKIKRASGNLIRTCPVCGFTFRTYNPKTRKKVTICPMCGYKFKESDLFLDRGDEFEKKLF